MWMHDVPESDPRYGVVPPEAESEIAWHNMIRQMRALPKPIIAAVNGLACGAGGGLMLGADIRIASENARFADIFIRRGIAGGSCLLTQTVATAKALELIFTGEFIDAAEGLPACRIESVDRAVAEIADQYVATEAAEVARRLCDAPRRVERTC